MTPSITSFRPSAGGPATLLYVPAIWSNAKIVLGDPVFSNVPMTGQVTVLFNAGSSWCEFQIELMVRVVEGQPFTGGSPQVGRVN